MEELLIGQVLPKSLQIQFQQLEKMQLEQKQKDQSLLAHFQELSEQKEKVDHVFSIPKLLQKSKQTQFQRPGLEQLEPKRTSQKVPFGIDQFLGQDRSEQNQFEKKRLETDRLQKELHEQLRQGNVQRQVYEQDLERLQKELDLHQKQVLN